MFNVNTFFLFNIAKVVILSECPKFKPLKNIKKDPPLWVKKNNE